MLRDGAAAAFDPFACSFGQSSSTQTQTGTVGLHTTVSEGQHFKIDKLNEMEENRNGQNLVLPRFGRILSNLPAHKHYLLRWKRTKKARRGEEPG